MSVLNLTPPPGHSFSRIIPNLTKHSIYSEKSPSQSLDEPLITIDDENRNHDHTKPELKHTYKKQIKLEIEENRQNNQEEINRNKYITRSFRYRLFFQKALLPNTKAQLTPLQIHLRNLKNGKPLSVEALKMLKIHFTRLGVDIHKIDRFAMESPEAHHSHLQFK